MMRMKRMSSTGGNSRRYFFSCVLWATGLVFAWHPAGAAAGQGVAAAGATPIQVATDENSIKVSETGRLDVHVRNTPISAVLEMLSYQARTNIVSSTSITGNVSANLYGLTLEQTLDAILTPNHLEFRKVGPVIYVGTPQEMSAYGPPPQARVFRLRYLPRAEAAQAVKPLLSPAGSIAEVGSSQQKAAGGGASATSMDAEYTDAGSDYLIVRDFKPQLDAIAKLLAQIDVRPKQVLVEATILRATLNEDNQLGIDLSYLGGVDFQNVNSVSAAGENLTTGALPPDQLQNTTLNVNTRMIGSFPGGGLTLGIIHNNVAAFIRALEEVTDVTVLANPKVIALNKQPGEVIVGRRDGYLTTTVTQTAAIQKVEFLETGTQIRFRPVINDDGTVRLTVWPKDSNGGLTAANLPFEETTEAHSHIIVEDGHTVLIGGLFRERTVSSRAQVPILGNVPGLGALFSRQSDQTVREEVIILLTVHVLKNTESEDARFAELLHDAERIRVGARRGLMATGRERLAQAFYREALAQARAGHRGRALLNARMALNNYPRHYDAFRLKEQLLAENMWETDATRARTFLLELIEDDAGAARKRLGRPPAAAPPSAAQQPSADPDHHRPPPDAHTETTR